MVAIIGILVALLLPAVQSARSAAQAVSCKNNLRQLGLAVLNHESSKRNFPPGSWIHSSGQNATGISWRVLLLPYIEEKALYNEIAPNSEGGGNLIQTTPPPTIFTCPSASPQDGHFAALKVSHYASMNGAGNVERKGRISLVNRECGDLAIDGIMYPRRLRDRLIRVKDVKDGTSKTLLIGELNYIDSSWVYGNTSFEIPGKLISLCSGASKNATYQIGTEKRLPRDDGDGVVNDLPYASHHKAGAQFVFADGHVELLPESTDLLVFKGMATRNGSD